MIIWTKYVKRSSDSVIERKPQWGKTRKEDDHRGQAKVTKHRGLTVALGGSNLIESIS